MNPNQNLLVNLTLEKNRIMKEKGVLISIYNNASGFLWSMAKVQGGTDLGWSEESGNPKYGYAFASYEDALQHAINLVNKCDLEKFHKNAPNGQNYWSNYASYVIKNYGNK